MSTLRKVKDAVDFLKQSGIKKVTLGFSCGKDSLICLDILRRADVEVIPIYFYIVPGLEFINDNIKMYERHFGIKVVKLPHPILYDYVNHQDWQTLDRTKDLLEYDLDKETFESLREWYLSEDLGIDADSIPDVAGIKMADSLNRRLMIRKIGYHDKPKNKLYLAKDFTNNEVYDYLKLRGIPLTPDYKLFGRSWDGLNYHYSFGVRKSYPKDWAKIKEYFPLIELEILRYEQFKRIKNL